MNNDEFNRFRSEFLLDAIELSDSKSIEYTIMDNDKLRNFKSVAQRLGITPLQALMVYMLKGVDAMATHAKSGNQYSDESFLSRCHDACNYAILAAALHTEETNHENNIEPNRDGTGSPGGDGAHDEQQEKWSDLKQQT